MSFLRRPFFIRLLNWEYWSFGMVYTWIYPVWILLCLRARSLFFFSASNPSIENGGFLNESKKDIHPLIPAEFSPATLFFSIPANAELVLKELASNGMDYPLIGKPDIGGRGRGVKVLADDEAVRKYVHTAFLNFHIQEFVSYKEEVGIFYYRYPNQVNGVVSGIVTKKFLSVRGDGKQSLLELIRHSDRALLQEESLKNIYGEGMNLVLPNGEERVLVPYGNHARGAMFFDDSHRIDAELTKTIDLVCKKISGFYFGRLDIRFDNWTDLKQGKKFAIIEVNGAGSEPTHIYDPKHSIFFAWAEIIRHWIVLNRISRMNHKKGFPYLSFKEGVRMFREDKENSRKLAAMPE